MGDWTLVLLAMTGLLVAAGPLVVVWRTRQSSKFRKLVWVGVFLTFDLVVFGAFTRLTDSGLGCPDWPGCYGQANPLLAHEQIRAAEVLMPTGPVTLPKAWIEMIHRFLASGIGALIVTAVAWSWYQWTRPGPAGRQAEYSPWLPSALLLLVCLQGAFGAWTVTLKLQPVIVTTHLLLGMALLALMTWLGARQDHAALLRAPPAPQVSPVLSPVLSGNAAAMRVLARLAALSAVLLVIQLALGGWVSTNYATLACSDYPLCDGQVIPAMDFEHGFTLWRALGKTAAGTYLPFSALTAIHWVHRNFALIVIAVLGWTLWHAWPHAALRKTVRRIAMVLALQVLTGIAAIYFSSPLAIAALHNAGAAMLVLLVTMLNYGAKSARHLP